MWLKYLWQRGKHPDAVGDLEYEKAVSRLRKVAGFDLDTFLKTIDDRSLFAEPLGPTSLCLSINEISALAQGNDSILDVPRVAVIKQHLISCDNCRKAIDLYKVLQSKEWPESDPEPLFLSSRSPVRFHTREKLVEITIGTCFPDAVPTFEIDPTSVSISGFIQADGCVITNSWIEKSSDLKFFTAKASGSIVGRFDPSVRQVCDWLEIRGKTTLGQPFYTKSLLSFKLDY